jgi:hypothetical protein
MAGCENLCTAAKCEELEARIEQLEAALQAHLTQAIPDAHDYNSNLKIEAFLSGKELGISIADSTSSDTASVNIPFCDESTCEEIEQKLNQHINQDISAAHNFECDLAIEAFYIGGGIGISIASCFGNDTTSVELPFCTIEDCGQITNEITNINNNVFNINNNFNTFLNNFNFTIENITNEYNQINNTITNIETNITNIETNITNIETNIIMPEDCCDEILKSIEEVKAIASSLINQLDYRANLIEEDVEEVKELVSVPIAGTIAAGSCQTVVLNEDTYSSYEPSAFGIPYSGNGLVGLHSALEAIDNKLTSIHTSTCQAIVPSWEVTFESLLELCGTTGGTGSNPETTITIPLSWAINKAVFNILKNQKTIQDDLCELDTGGGDVVSIVASDKDVARVSSKLLVLHWVTLDNYPIRGKYDSYWQSQVPLAKDDYNWQDDFQDLRWYRGNTYAELRFQEPLASVSGYFENETRANQFFDAILALTNATEANRVITLYDNPKTNIAQQVTRPYRAFILQPQPDGKPICEIKYQPPSS